MTSPVPRKRFVPSIVVLGDLVIDMVVRPQRPVETGTDVPGSVQMRQGGSAAGTARWIGRLGARVQLVTAVGRDGAGRALIESVRRDRVQVRGIRVAGQRTGRIAVLIGPSGERSFVADRRAADGLRPEALQPAWFAGIDALHLPAYSLLGDPLGRAGRRSVELARSAGAAVTVDLASSRPLLARGRSAAQRLIGSVAPDVLFATEAEATALLGDQSIERLLELAPVAIVKRGIEGATVLARAAATGADAGSIREAVALRFEVATRAIDASDTTGAGDAFDAGFLVAWLDARATDPDRRASTAALRRATLAGHRVAARHLSRPREELAPG